MDIGPVLFSVQGKARFAQEVQRTKYLVKPTKKTLSNSLKCTKSPGRQGFAPDPIAAAYSSPLDPIPG